MRYLVKFQIVLLMVFGSMANAALLDYSTDGRVSLGEGSFEHVSAVSDVSSFDIAFSSGPEALKSAFFAFDPMVPTFAAFDLQGAVASVLNVGYLDDLLQFELEAFDGYSNGAILSLSGLGLPAGNPFEQISILGDAVYENVVVQIEGIGVEASVPSPSGLILVLSGLACLMLARTKHSRALLKGKC